MKRHLIIYTIILLAGFVGNCGFNEERAKKNNSETNEEIEYLKSLPEINHSIHDTSTLINKMNKNKYNKSVYDLLSDSTIFTILEKTINLPNINNDDKERLLLLKKILIWEYNNDSDLKYINQNRIKFPDSKKIFFYKDNLPNDIKFIALDYDNLRLQFNTPDFYNKEIQLFTLARQYINEYFNSTNIITQQILKYFNRYLSIDDFDADFDSVFISMEISKGNDTEALRLIEAAMAKYKHKKIDFTNQWLEENYYRIKYDTAPPWFFDAAEKEEMKYE